MNIKIRINVAAINKAKLFKGKKGTWYDAVLIPTPNSQYNDYLLKEDQTKEEREAGKDDVIIGNGKNMEQGLRDTNVPVRTDITDSAPNVEPEDLPF